MLKEKSIKISQAEYKRLKTLDLEFGKLIRYMKYIDSLDMSRKQIAKGETIPLEKILKEYKIK